MKAILLVGEEEIKVEGTEEELEAIDIKALSK